MCEHFIKASPLLYFENCLIIHPFQTLDSKDFESIVLYTARRIQSTIFTQNVHPNIGTMYTKFIVKVYTCIMYMHVYA